MGISVSVVACWHFGKELRSVSADNSVPRYRLDAAPWGFVIHTFGYKKDSRKESFLYLQARRESNPQ